MKTYNVLFLCTGNSARSILTEAILNQEGAGRFRAFSAGSHPKGAVHPQALRQLAECGLSAGGARSKSWDEFAAEGAPKLDFVITVCYDAAGETCPIWPSQPTTAHWGIPDPAAAPAATHERAFRDAYLALENRIRLFLALPLESIDEMSLQTKLREIGKSGSLSLTDHDLVRLDSIGMHQMKDALRGALLDADDLDDDALAFRLDDADGPIGWAALERFGEEALLRSVLIAASKRASGSGAELVRQVMEQARNCGIARLWLLTETAAPFFAKLGFRIVHRSEAPEVIRATSQFASICPASATCMSVELVA